MTHHKIPPLPDSYLPFIFIKRYRPSKGKVCIILSANGGDALLLLLGMHHDCGDAFKEGGLPGLHCYLRFIFIKRFTDLAWVKFESFCPQMGVMHYFCYWWCIMIVAMHLKRADYQGFTEQACVTKGWNTGNLGANAFIFGGARQNYIQVRISKYIHALTTSWVNQVFIFSSSVFISVCQIVDRIQSMW